MMNVDEFLESVSALNLRLSAENAREVPAHPPATMDALFHLPLLALLVLVIARRRSFSTLVLGRSVAMLLVEHFAALRRSPHSLETSVTLRRRCADALAFLESVGLVMVSEEREHVITLTQAGKNRIDNARQDESDLGLLVRQLLVTQERVKARIGNDER
jgi:hypothetical protein